MGLAASSLFSPQRCELDLKREQIFIAEEKALIKQAEDDCEVCFSDLISERSIDQTDGCCDQLDPSLYKFPFENVIFEGGGNKGLAYCGAIKCLEEMKILPQIKRMAGTSAGAITATLLAVGYNYRDIEEFLSDNVEKTFIDHSYGYLSLLPNLIRGWGWNPGKRIFQWFGDKIEAKTGNPDLTFHELYKMKNIELCIVVTNLNQMRAEYCHPKTTPNMSIREALRMSMSIPVVFMACVHDNNGQKDTYVDGGVLCNYPINCFDGWYLSMEKKHSFLLQMQTLDDMSQLFSVKNKFLHESADSKINHKSIGFLLYDDIEVEVMRDTLDKRPGAVWPKKPSKPTWLYKKKQRDRKVQKTFRTERNQCQNAAEAFMKALQKYNIEDEVHIDKEELRKALNDETILTPAFKEKLFGKNVTLDEAFNFLDRDGNGQIDFQELVRFLEKRHIRVQNRITGFNRTEINSLMDFGSALQNSWTTNMKYVYFGEEDINRTVGINTGHVSTSDYKLEKEDRLFLVNRGYCATLAFLRLFMKNNADKLVERAAEVVDVVPPRPDQGEE